MAAEVKLMVTRADNEVAAWVNGVLVYHKDTGSAGDPILNDVVDLTPALVCGNNTLVVIGINWKGPANYQGSLAIGKFVTPFKFTSPDTPSGMPWNQTFCIPYCC
jgi:hypothetical protein